MNRSPGGWSAHRWRRLTETTANAGLALALVAGLALLVAGPGHRFGVGQGRKRLVALIGEQKTFDITAEALALGAVSKKIVEPSGVIFQRTGSGLYRLPLGHGGTTSYRDRH